ncbi:Hemerythrin-like domain-containing protein OS=Castellaniella defragrans OX=75697 GN=HNR28_003364 PE=4 SV=1 [Castellaniella defragrans]
MNIERFKSQHVEILTNIKRMREYCHAGIVENSKGIEAELRKLRVLVKSHISLEDSMLYPALERQADDRVKNMARTFQEEMAGLASAFVDFVQTWDAPAIASKPEEFRADANQTVKALHQRIQHENTEFYPAVEGRR